MKKKFTSRLIAFATMLLGFLTGCEEGCGTCLYGTPEADYKVSGIVSEEDGQPVPDAVVNLVAKYHQSGAASGSDGFYEIVMRKPCDGASYKLITKAEGFVPDTTEVRFGEPSGGDDSGYEGTAEATVNVTLKKSN